MQIKAIKDKIYFNHQNEVSKTTIDQFHFLQNTLGNQKVQEMVRTGVITMHSGKNQDVEIQIRKQKENEAGQIQADRNDLNPQIEKLAMQKQAEFEELRQENPTKDIFINVATELHFVQIPGENPHEFYHYTDLLDVNFSLNNTATFGEPVLAKRGYTIKVVDSFLCKWELAVAAKEAEEVEPETPEDEVEDKEAAVNEE